MSVLLPWNRNKSAKKEAPRGRAQSPTLIRSVARSTTRPWAAFLTTMGILAAGVAVLAIVSLWPAPVETVWEAPGARLMAARSGHYLVADGGGCSLIDDDCRERRLDVPPGKAALGQEGVLVILDLSETERLASVLDDGTILAIDPAGDGVFGEAWELSARTSSGTLMWKSKVPGAVSVACRRGDRIVVGVADISAGGTPSVLVLDGATGRTLWTRALPMGVWRGLGVLSDGLLVAALDTGITAFQEDGLPAWAYCGTGSLVSAVIVGDTTCVAERVSHGLTRFVCPFELLAISPDGTAKWSRRLRAEPLGLQQWMGEQAVVALAKNLVVGFEIRDGERLFAERIGADPVDLTGDKLLVRDPRGLRLVRLRSVRSG